MDAADQIRIDSENSEFWNTLCGSVFAQSIGVTDDSPASLARFDDWFFRLYPYLDGHLDLDDLKGRRVLEVGLGYGSVGQKIAAAGADYMGLDIAAGPVGMMRRRLRQSGLSGDATQGSILAAPFDEASFEAAARDPSFGDKSAPFASNALTLAPFATAALVVGA